MSRNQEMLAALDALSRTRALTDMESNRLERLLRAEGLIPSITRDGNTCANGHAIEGANVVMHNSRPTCRTCRDLSARRSHAKARAKLAAAREQRA